MQYRRFPFPVFALLGLMAGVLFAPAAHAGKCPNLVIVLDKSGSMTSAPNGGTAPPGGSKWDLAKKAVKKVVEDYDGKFPIGLALFASDSNCGAARLDVPPDYGTKMKITQLIDATTPNSNTPTMEAIDSMRMQPQMRDPLRGQYLMLITDGAPGCGDGGNGNGSERAVADAKKQNPPITTFVVGFGSLPATAQNIMSRLAEAGGKPVMGGAQKFYAAESLESLQKALDDIIAVVMGELGGGACDDSCYSNPCPNPGDMCIRAECRPNPCQGVVCGKDLYCYTDGISPGTCIRSCTKPCPSNTRCQKGACVPDPCGIACPAGTVCDANNKRCVTDPLCQNIPLKDQCKVPARCQFGKCVDDPCKFVTCPKDTRCVPWEGSCESTQGSTGNPDMGGGDDDDTTTRRGCATAPGASVTGAGPGIDGTLAPLCGLLAFAAVLGLSRRRRK